MKSYLKNIVSIGTLAGYFPKKVFFLSCLYLVLAALDVLGLSLLAFSFSTDSDSFDDSFFGISLDSIHQSIVLIVLIFIFFLKFVAALSVSWVLSQQSLIFLSKLRDEVFKRYLRLNSSNGGHLKDKLQTILDFTNVCGARIPETIIRTIGEVFILLGVSGFLIYRFGLVFFLVVVFFGIGLLVVGGVYMSRQGSNLGVRITEKQNEIIGISAEVLGKLEEVSVNGYGKWVFNKFHLASSGHARFLATERYVSSLPKYFFELLTMFTILGLVGWKSFVSGAEISSVIVELMIIAVAGLKILPVINQFVTSIYLYKAAGPAISAIGRLVQMDAINWPDEQSTKPYRSDDIPKIEFESSTVILPNDRPLNVPKMTFQSGDITLITGPSGVGKSSFIKILLGLSDNCSPLTFGGLGLDRQYLSNTIAYLSQDGLIFNESLIGNVAVVIDDCFDYDRFRRACRDAELSDQFVEVWSNKRLGDDGSLISGGERQRVLIARLFYEDKPLWFLDEATSALDLHTENKIFDQITRRGCKIVFVISHSSNQTYRFTRKLKIENQAIIEI